MNLTNKCQNKYLLSNARILIIFDLVRTSNQEPTHKSIGIVFSYIISYFRFVAKGIFKYFFVLDLWICTVI